MLPAISKSLATGLLALALILPGLCYGADPKSDHTKVEKQMQAIEYPLLSLSPDKSKFPTAAGLKTCLEADGVKFPSGSNISLRLRGGIKYAEIRQTPDNLDLIEQIADAIVEGQDLRVEVEISFYQYPADLAPRLIGKKVSSAYFFKTAGKSLILLDRVKWMAKPGEHFKATRDTNDLKPVIQMEGFLMPDTSLEGVDVNLIYHFEAPSKQADGQPPESRRMFSATVRDGIPFVFTPAVDQFFNISAAGKNTAVMIQANILDSTGAILRDRREDR